MTANQLDADINMIIAYNCINMRNNLHYLTATMEANSIKVSQH